MRKRHGALALTGVALTAALTGCSSVDGVVVGGETVWSASFGEGAPGAESFSSPRGTSHGECAVWESDDAAFYKWVDSSDDGRPTRCYPVHLFARESDDGTWVDPAEGAWRFTGRFWVDLGDDPQTQLGGGPTFSLLTFLPSPPQDTDDGRNRWLSSTTVNVEWSTAADAPQLNVWHVPGQGRGDFERISDITFPDERWVTIGVDWAADGTITVRQDGEMVLRAKKERYDLADGGEANLTGARLFGFHAGGYVSAAITDWTIGNADFRLESLE